MPDGPSKNCPLAHLHGDPWRYCPCGWTEPDDKAAAFDRECPTCHGEVYCWCFKCGKEVSRA